jgi:glycosyltransferase involved in cell wall biosynthesis
VIRSENSPEGRIVSRPDRLKVLVYTSLFPNSVQPLSGHFVLERLSHLLPYVDCSVVAPAPYFPKLKLNARWYQFSQIPSTERLNGLELDHPRFVVLPKIGMVTHGLSMFLGSARTVASRIRRERYDLIDAHYVYPDGFAAMLLGSWLNIPVVVSARGSDINVFPRFRAIRPLIRRVLARADALIAVSQSLKDQMVDLGCSAEKITVIGNGVDSRKFYPRSRSEMRQDLGLSPTRPIFLSVGHLNENKGFHVLIDAVAQLRAARPDVLLLIIGEGVYRSHLEQRIRDLNLMGNVQLVGARPNEELVAWYGASDVFCLASETEGSPNVVMEALACGRPVIATHAAASMLNFPSLGIPVERTPHEFRLAMERALAVEWNAGEIAEHVRSRGWDGVARQVMEVFSGVIERRNAGVECRSR